MKLIHTAMLLGMMASALALQASPLTPEQALDAAMRSNSAPLRAPGRSYSLCMTQAQDDAPTLYIYNAEKQPGFIVLAAESNARTLVWGYSDAEAFDPDNIPPAMQWWLKVASATVASDAAGIGGDLRPAKLPAARIEFNTQQEAATTLSKAPARAARRTISPMVSTKWNQDAPYNNLCPTLGGRRAVTGCVATAMAQVMKYHNYPTKGTGSKSYQYRYGYQNYTASANFGNTTYDWKNMLDTYNATATAAQKTAVATLMYHCGVASEMSYSPDGSGTSDVYAGAGLIAYLGYDKSMQYLERDWFDAQQWDEMVYSQLDEGLPMMYCGNDGESGHAFVCDGYNSNGLYHINWGWGGVADGYFELANLDPYTQGIGGGTGEDGFNYGQSILYNFRPDRSGSEYKPVFGVSDTFGTSATSYTVGRMNDVQFTGGFFSYSLATLTMTVGVYCKGENVDKFLAYGYTDFEPLTGFYTMDIATTDFPQGEYEVCPAFIYNNQPYLMYTQVNAGDTGVLHFNVSGNTITVTSSAPAETELESSFQGWTADNGIDEGFYPGHSYHFTFDVTSTTPWEGETYFVIIDGNYTLKAYSDPVDLKFDQAGTIRAEYAIDIFDSVLPGSYYACVCYDDGQYLNIIEPIYNITVREAPERGEISVPSIVFAGSPTDGTSASEPAILQANNQEITVTVRCDKAPWTDGIMLAFADINTMSVFSFSESIPLKLTQDGQTATVTFTGPWKDVEASTTYVLAVMSYAQASEGLEQHSGARFFYINDTTGVEAVEADSAPAEYYNLQGIRVDAPGSGLYIRRCGSNASKQLLR